MLRAFLAAILAAAMTMVCGPALVGAASELPADSGVKGLWIKLPQLAGDVSDAGFEMNEAGAVSYTRLVDGGLMAVVVERMPSVGADGEDVYPDNIASLVAGFEGIDEKAVTVKAADGLSTNYTYPVYLVEFSSGDGEDARKNMDLFMFTDPWLFRVHVSVGGDYEGDYRKKVMGWFNNLSFRE